MTVREIAESRELIPSRWFAAWIDFLAVLGILVVGDGLLGNALYQSTIAFWLLLAVAYFPVLEGRWGRTLGRLATGTIVVDEEGRVPGLKRASLRTLTRLIEVNPILLGGLPAGIAVICSRYHQRLGDMWAGTYVLRKTELEAVRASLRLVAGEIPVA